MLFDWIDRDAVQGVGGLPGPLLGVGVDAVDVVDVAVAVVVDAVAETGAAFASGQWHTVDAPLGKLPLFARAGAAIPCAAPAPGQVARHDDPVAEVRKF